MTAWTRVGSEIDILGESPLWHEAEQALYWVDIRRPALRRLDYASGRVESWPMPDLVGSIAFCDDGRLLVALPDRIAAEHSRPSPPRPPRSPAIVSTTAASTARAASGWARCTT
jgi:sugar lactone lactonase YvrE